MKSKQKSSPKIRLPYYGDIIAVAKERKVNGSSLHVLIYLLTRVNTTRSKLTCWPSQATIIEDTGLNERTVRRALKNLERLKLIRSSKHSLTGNLLEYEVLQWWTKVQGSPGQKCRYDPVKSTGMVPDKSAGNHPDKNACLELYKKNLPKLNQQNELPPPPPSGASGSVEEEDKNFSPNFFSKTHSTARHLEKMRRFAQNDAPLSRNDQLAEIKEKMKAIKNNTSFANLPLEDRRLFINSGVQYRTLKDRDKEFAADLESFALEALRQRQHDGKPVHHAEAWLLTFKFNCLAGRQPDFEYWRECDRNSNSYEEEVNQSTDKGHV